MKRSIAIVLVLLIFVTIINFDWIGNRLRFLISDERTARNESVKTIADSPSLGSIGMGREAVDDSSADPQLPESPQPTTAETERLDDGSEVRTIPLSITGEVSPLHFIKSSSILGPDKPTDAQIDRLHRSIATIAAGLQPSAIILDADATTQSGSHFLLFAREGFDLTTHVKAVYDTLSNETDSLPKTTKLENGAGKQVRADSE